MTVTSNDYDAIFPERYSARVVLQKIRDALRHRQSDNVSYFSILHENFMLMNHEEWLEFASFYPAIATLVREPTDKYYLTRDNNADIIARVAKGLHSSGFAKDKQRKIYARLASLVSIATTRSAELICNPSSNDCTQSCYFKKEMGTGRILTACEHSNALFSFPDGEQLYKIKFDFALEWDDLVKVGAIPPLST